jgi:hypothetical protein
MGEMAILCSKGDSKQIWNPDNEDEVKAVRTLFNSLIKKGYSAFRVDKAGEKAGRMEEFDPEAGKVIMVPLVRGG